jgi:copper chaperone for superoxide dismutase
MNKRLTFLKYCLQAVYAVPMHCSGCSSTVEGVLQSLPGYRSVVSDLTNQTVSLTSSTPPSLVVRALRERAGKDAIVRGAGVGGANGSGAAVAILESFDTVSGDDKKVLGLVRLVSVGQRKTLFDISLSGEKGFLEDTPGTTYYANIRKSGDISQGAFSTGGVLHFLSKLTVALTHSSSAASKPASTAVPSFWGQAYVTKHDLAIDELIGRSITVTKNSQEAVARDTLVGVIARSAGVWQNDKTVCSCTGKTVWEERKDAIDRGVL